MGQETNIALTRWATAALTLSGRQYQSPGCFYRTTVRPSGGRRPASGGWRGHEIRALCFALATGTASASATTMIMNSCLLPRPPRPSLERRTL